MPLAQLLRPPKSFLLGEEGGGESASWGWRMAGEVEANWLVGFEKENEGEKRPEKAAEEGEETAWGMIDPREVGVEGVGGMVVEEEEEEREQQRSEEREWKR
jgi:hypothetical protein